MLLLEAGGPDYRFDFRTQMPAALAYPLQGRRYNWAYETEPEPHMNNRRMECGRGKGLGGSSLINGMCYIRGNALDYDGWAERKGLENWSYLDCLPYFSKAETRDIGANAYHGGDGPVHVTTSKPGNNPLFGAMVEAGVQAGYPRTDDLNGYQQEGFGPMDRTVTANGRRASTARGYLDQARQRPNLTIVTHATTDRILFIGQACQRRRVSAWRHERRPRTHAAKCCCAAARSPRRKSCSARAWARSRGCANWIFRSCSICRAWARTCRTTSRCTCSTSARSPSRSIPRCCCATNRPSGSNGCLGARASARATTSKRAALSALATTIRGRTSSITSCRWRSTTTAPMRSRCTASRRTSARCARPAVAASNCARAIRMSIRAILFNYMAEALDWREFRDAIRITREIIRQPALDRFRGRELSPGADLQSDAEIDAFVRARAETAYHPSCSCAMGYDEMAVVDNEGRVHGLEGLRVVDASIMPRITTGNLNAPTIMLAEKIADRIRGRAALARVDTPYFVAGGAPARGTSAAKRWEENAPARSEKLHAHAH